MPARYILSHRENMGDLKKNASKVYYWGSNFKIALSLSFLRHPNQGISKFQKQILV